MVMRIKNLAIGLFLIIGSPAVLALAQTSPANPTILQGNKDYEAKDYAKALEDYQAAVKLDSNSAPAYQGVGNAYYQMGKTADAFAAYDKSLQLNPNNVKLSTFVQALKAQSETSSASAPSSSTASEVAVPAPPTVSESSGQAQAPSAPVPQAPSVSPASESSASPAKQATSPASASETEKSTGGYFFGGIGLGGSLAVNGFSPLYNPGLGLDLTFGYAINENFSILMAMNGMLFSTSISGLYSGEANFVPSLKYALGDGKVKLYWMAGLGLNEDVATDDDTTLSQGNLLFEGGVGVQASIDSKLDVYVQGKYSYVFAPTNFSYVPITAGVIFH